MRYCSNVTKDESEGVPLLILVYCFPKWDKMSIVNKLDLNTQNTRLKVNKQVLKAIVK